jgi:type II secretory pathway component PulK
MINQVSRREQRGATLVVGLIMLVLITLMVTTAFMLSTGNLKSVGNMQFRGEALAAANRVIEQVLASPFTDDPADAAQEIEVDIDKDGKFDYTVVIAEPVCVRATIAAATP